MLLNPHDAHNMQLYVTALYVADTSIIAVQRPNDIVTDHIDVAASGADGTPYTISAHGHETFDDTNDAIAYAMRGDDTTYAAYRITTNPNYTSDHYDLVIYSRVPITCTILHGANG